MRAHAAFVMKLALLSASYYFSSVAQASAADKVVEIPFELFHNSIVVQATVNGKGPFNMLLDTGVDPSVIDLNTAKTIGLKLAVAGYQGTGGGTEANLAHETRLPLVQLGKLAARDVDATAIDMSKTSAALGKPIQGVLGYSLLKDRIVQIDYPKQVVRFYATSPYQNKTHGSNAKPTQLTFSYRDDVLANGVSVNGKPIIANVDTGDNGSFQLTPAAVAKLGLQTQVANAKISRSVGFNGATENREATVKNITIGGISIDQPSVIFYGKGTGRDDEAWGIRIGNAFLKNFIVTIDYQNKLITLESPVGR